MSPKKLISSIFILLFFVSAINAQTTSDPVRIDVTPGAESVAPGMKSHVVVQFQIPKGIIIGANQSYSRIPPATIITPVEIAGFNFSQPIFPEPEELWVPAKLGKTKVFKEKIGVVIPFEVGENVSEGNYELKFLITYTPGYAAGRFNTHSKEEYTATIVVQKDASVADTPVPFTGLVGENFRVEPKSFDQVSKPFKFLFKPFDEETFIPRLFHKIWLDKPGHGKSVRFLPFPFALASNITGSSAGIGASIFNSTKEGTLTGSFAISGFANDLIGGGVGIQAISCPGAYHNYQFIAFFGGEGWRNIRLDYEDFTIANTLIGVNFTFDSTNEPRQRFNGIGALTEEEDETAYERTNLEGILDLYVLPTQNFRIGLGYRYINYDVGLSFEDIKEDEGIEFLQDTPLAEGLNGLDGATVQSIRGNIIYDHRDQEFAPSKGFFAKLTLARNFLTDIDDPELIDDFNSLSLDVRQYFSDPSQKLVGLLRGGLELKSESDIPFYELSALGGPMNMRAYDFERFLGQHAAFGSAEVRYTLATIPILGYPMSIEGGVFLDVGQVFGDGESFGDELNVDPGFTFRMINKPNVGLVLNYAFGEDGGYITGGIGLPL